jgi:type VI secretion system protein ImpK
VQRSGAAPVPSLKFFRSYCAVLLELRDLALQPATLDDAPVESAPPNASPSTNGTNGAIPPNGTTAATAANGTVLVATETAPPPATLRVSRPQSIWNQLALLIDQQLIDASRMAGPLGLEFHREAVYVMAALTDEIFVHLKWEGQEFWLSHLLEARFFRSHFAGERFFQRIDQLLTRDDDPAGELAGVYLTALALGFRGRFWGPLHNDIVDSYRKRLFYFMTRRDPELAESRAQLFPEAYRNAIREGVVLGMPEPRRWLLALAGVFVIWLIATYIIWSNLSSGIRHRLCCLSPECSLTCSSTNTGK